MPIPQSNYVLITSGVAGAPVETTRNLGALIITSNTLAPTGSIVSFTSAAAVGTYFGTSSEEYARAVFYFAFISKSITQAQQISFYFWNNDIATASLIFGASATYALSTFTTISAGNLTMTLGGFTHELTAINLSGDASLTAVAASVQAAIRTYSAGGTAWTGATVAYNSSTNNFTLTSGATGADIVSISVSASPDVGAALGWETGAIYSNGIGAETPTQNLNNLLNITNNFGSFCYAFTLAPTLTTIEAAANWNVSLTPNVQYIFSINVTPTNSSTWSTALLSIGGCTLTLQSPGAQATIEFPEMCPTTLLGATDYTRPNSVQNYEFNQFSNLTPSVTTQANYTLYTGMRVNFYGSTQQAGQIINFYQQGVMMGLATDPLDQNVYANEIWFKDAIGVSLMNLLLGLNQIAADSIGRAQILGTLQSIINIALLNGTIETGATLTTLQIADITQITGSATAWRQVQTDGYWVNVVFQTYQVAGVTQYEAVYTLVYKKNDVIRRIIGSDVLI